MALAASHTELVSPFIGVPNVVVHAIITPHTTANLAINLSRFVPCWKRESRSFRLKKKRAKEINAHWHSDTIDTVPKGWERWVTRRPTAHPLFTSLVCTRGTYASLHIVLSPSLSFVPHRRIIKLFTLVFIWVARSSPLGLEENACCNRRRPPFTTNKKIILRSTEPTFFSIALHTRGVLPSI